MAILEALSPLTEVEFLRLLDVSRICLEGGMFPWQRLVEGFLGRTMSDVQFDDFLKNSRRVLGVTQRLSGQPEDLVERCRTYGHRFLVYTDEIPAPQCLYCGRETRFWSNQQTTQPLAGPNVSGNNYSPVHQSVGGSGGSGGNWGLSQGGLIGGSGLAVTAAPNQSPISVTAPVLRSWLKWPKP